MNLWESIVLGVVQGATEFLPVSSSGHLVLGQELLGLRLPGIGFEVAVHLATLISIAWVYRARIATLGAGAISRDRDALYQIGLLFVATIPAGVLGVLFGDWLEARFDAPHVAAIGFLVTGAILMSTVIPMRKKPTGAPVLKVAVVMGLAQALALFPGVSRSGSTVAAALWMGVAPVEAAAFSFLMALPAIGGAAVLKAPDLFAGPVGMTTPVLLAGSLASALTGILAIRTLVALLKRQDFHRFAWYLWPLGVGFLIYLWLGTPAS